jgi:ankyrin repeat protein
MSTLSSIFEGNQSKDTPPPRKGMSINAMAARIIELEEANSLLLDENAVLSDSVKLYQSLLEENAKELEEKTAAAAAVFSAAALDAIPPRSGHGSNFKKGQRRRKNESAKKILQKAKTSLNVENITSDMSEDALMVGTLNHLTALVKKYALNKLQRDEAEKKRNLELEHQVAASTAAANHAAKGGSGGFIPLHIPETEQFEHEEGLDDTLRHVFVDSVHLLSEFIVDPNSFLAKESAEYFTKSKSTAAASADTVVAVTKSPSIDAENNLMTPIKGKRETENEGGFAGYSPNAQKGVCTPTVTDTASSGNGKQKKTTFSQSGDNIHHPITWLLDQFPILPREKQKEKENPSSSQEGLSYDCKDWFPLHWAVISDANELIDVETLLTHYGSDAYYNLDMQPLLLAVSKQKPSREICTSLISFFEVNNKNVNSDDANEVSVQDDAKSNSNSTVGTGGKKKNDLVSISNDDGVFPCMLAAAYNDTDELLKLMHEINPQLLWETDQRGWRAIHYACLKGCIDVANFIIQQHPKSSQAATRNGGLPLHFAAKNHYIENEEDNLKLLTSIFGYNTSAINIKDELGALPLHYAAKDGTVSGVQFLTQTYPKAINIADKEGLLPMHFASSRSDTLPQKTEVVEYILSQNSSENR